ncbi:MAG: hypothetical protein ABI583_06100 [Betaproteobacteria bacterium]
MSRVQKSIVGIVLLLGSIAIGAALFFSSIDGAKVESRNPVNVAMASTGVLETKQKSTASPAIISNMTQVQMQSEAPVYKALPELVGLNAIQRTGFLRKALADKTNSYIAGYQNPVEALTDLVRLGKAGDIGATLAAQKLANRCADTAADSQSGRIPPFGIPLADCQAMSKEDFKAIPGLLAKAANSGDPLAKYVIMDYSNYFSGEAYMQTFLHDPNLLAYFQQETRVAQEYFEPLASEAVLGNIALTYQNGTVLPRDPVMQQAYLMAAFTVAATHVPDDKNAWRLNFAPASIDGVGSQMTSDQRSAALQMAQTILNRCCNGLPLPPVLSQRRG